MNENPGIATGAAVAAVVICLAYLAYSMMGPSVEEPTPLPEKAFYTTDDGKTYYEDADDKIPPYTKDGKQAYRAVVYRCGEDAPKIAWIERFPAAAHPAIKKIHDEYKSAKADSARAYSARLDRDDAIQQIASKAVEARLVNSPTWVRRYDPRSAAQFVQKCPEGKIPEEVFPK